MADQPAPDFEEARRDAEAWLANDDPPQARHQLASNLSRAYLALLNEREARERPVPLEDMQKLQEYAEHVGGRYPGAANLMRRVAKALYQALPATESAQPPDRNSGHSPEEVVEQPTSEAGS